MEDDSQSHLRNFNDIDSDKTQDIIQIELTKTFNELRAAVYRAKECARERESAFLFSSSRPVQRTGQRAHTHTHTDTDTQLRCSEIFLLFFLFYTLRPNRYWKYPANEFLLLCTVVVDTLSLEILFKLAAARARQSTRCNCCCSLYIPAAAAASTFMSVPFSRGGLPYENVFSLKVTFTYARV
ncbi:unnamed protein product [Trichogramma brassicae]|uniref:Uncharacterized protein n=1 Tax=Trichogramma brassicae TaxID=86971 RepID=A0A6H5IDW4_9HYME|nr:unnamed protein product [Trichogramma brassicae]